MSITITLSGAGDLRGSITGQCALYDTVPVTITGKAWPAGHALVAFLASPTTAAYWGGTDAITESVGGTGVATWTFNLPCTHSALLAAATVGQSTKATLHLWDATAARHACVCDLRIEYAPEPTGWVQSDPVVSAATVVQLTAAVAAHNTSGTAHADIRAAMVTWPAADSETAIADANRFAVGQLAGATWTWVAKTGTQLQAWLKTWADLLYAGITHKSRHATGGADALSAADIGAATAGHNHDASYDAAGLADAAYAAARAASTPVAHASETTAAHGGIVASGDSRLADARTPTAHKTSHATGQSDALAAADIGAEPTQTAASQAEMEAGTEAGIRSVSPLRVAQAIAALGGGLSGTGAVDNAVLRADGTGGETLQSSDLSIEDAATATQANVAITNQHAGQTNSALVLTPKGTGALILGPKPDGTATGGHARGEYACDLQLLRSNAAHVASGGYSVAVGSYCTPSGGYAVTIGSIAAATGSWGVAIGSTVNVSGCNTVAIGSQLTVSGAYACATGRHTQQANANARSHGMENLRNGTSSQITDNALGRTTASTDPVEMFTNQGVSGRMVLPAEWTWRFRAVLVGRQDNGKSGWAEYVGMIERTANTTRLVGSVSTVTAWSGDAELGTPTLAITADDTNEALAATITPANTTSTCWSLFLQLCEVYY